MAHRTPPSPKPLGTPEWIYPWKRGESVFYSTLLAAVLMAGLFIFAFASIRVKLTVPMPIVPQKASLIFLTNTPEGRALALKAQEGGPFPSRFRPGQWDGMAALEAAAMAPTHLPQEIHTPQLKVLPEVNMAALRIAPPPLEMTFPASVAALPIPREARKMKLAPQLFPLSGITAQDLPQALPPFPVAIDGAMASASWRFLLQLGPHGRVTECISLGKGGDPGALELQQWLSNLTFPADEGNPARWIALGLGFTNQADDGPDN